MTRRAIKPGTKFREVLTSKFINELTKPEPSSLGGSGFGFKTENLIVSARCALTATIDTFDPVLITAHGTTNYSNPAEVLNTSGTSPEVVPQPLVDIEPISSWVQTRHGNNPTWGIALDRITQDSGLGRVLLSGVSYLKLTNPPTTNRLAYTGIDIRRNNMVFGLKGRAEIIGNLTAGSHALVHLGRRTQTAMTGITTGTIQPNSPGTVNVEIPGGATEGLTGGGTFVDNVWNPHRSKAVLGNRRVVCVDVCGLWVIVFEECP